MIQYEYSKFLAISAHETQQMKKLICYSSKFFMFTFFAIQ